MNPRRKPEQYKPEEVEEHRPRAETGFAEPSSAGAPAPRRFQKPTDQTRAAAEQATRSALMDCYNG
ncbi:MAG: hypothetical protein R3191_01615 [Anaerolineales bacterium]|nr:hypothetical protein [Anaerolineales bacterium]